MEHDGSARIRRSDVDGIACPPQDLLHAVNPTQIAVTDQPVLGRFLRYGAGWHRHLLGPLGNGPESDVTTVGRADAPVVDPELLDRYAEPLGSRPEQTRSRHRRYRAVPGPEGLGRRRATGHLCDVAEDHVGVHRPRFGHPA